AAQIGPRRNFNRLSRRAREPVPSSFPAGGCELRVLAERNFATAVATVSSRAATFGWRRLFGKPTLKRDRRGRLAKVAGGSRVANRCRLAGAGGRGNGPLRLGRARARWSLPPPE